MRIAAWSPDAVVIALGLNASEKNPLAFLAVTTPGFEAIRRRLGGTDWPTLLVKEGRYISDIRGQPGGGAEELRGGAGRVSGVAVQCLSPKSQILNGGRPHPLALFG